MPPIFGSMRTGTPVSRLDIDNEISRYYIVTGVPSAQLSEFAGMVFQRARMDGVLSGDARLTGILTEMRAVAERYGLTQNPEAAALAAHQRANEHGTTTHAVLAHGADLLRHLGPLAWGAAAGNSERGGYAALRGGAVNYNDVGSVTLANYAGSPFAATGMTYSTFQSLSAQGFQAHHILHAGQDTRRHGFNPNGPMARSFAVLDREDGARRAERNQHLERLRRAAEQDEQLKVLRREYEAARTPEEKARVLAQIDERGRQIQRDTGYAGFAGQAPTEAGRVEGGRVGAAVVRRGALGYENTTGLNVGDDVYNNRMSASERQNLDARTREIERAVITRAALGTAGRAELGNEAAALLGDTTPRPVVGPTPTRDAAVVPGPNPNPTPNGATVASNTPAPKPTNAPRPA